MKKFISLILIACSACVYADSNYVNLQNQNLSARDFEGTMIEGGFSVNNGQVHWWNAPGSWMATGGYHVLDTTTGVVSDMGQPDSVLTNGFGDPFGVYDEQNNCFYAATYYGAGDSYLYKYDDNNLTWSSLGSAVNLYGGAVSSGNLYVSGLIQPWSGGYDDTYISLYDLTGSGNHDVIIGVGGASAHVAVSDMGDVYYATYEPTGTAALYRWTAADVAGVINDIAAGETDTYLSLSDGQKLSNLAGGANGITVDGAGHVFVSYNSMDSSTPSALCMWNGISGEGLNYDILATAGDYGNWFGPLAIDGDFLKGDSLYGSFGFGASITEITYVPEPATMLSLAVGSMILYRRRKA